MPPSEPSRVFISYARKDGASLAQRLESDLRNAGLDAWLDTQRIKGGAVWSEDIDRAIDSCQVMIAVLTTGSYESGMCRGEQLRALDKGKRLVPVLAEKGADRTTYLYRFQYRDFTNDSDYLARLAELISDIRGDATATLPDAYRKTRVTYLTAPPRVANYLERPEALHALRDALFAEDHRQPIALTALHGMGGIGKTVLAKALTDDQVVQRAFPDGIVWITAGHERQRDFTAEMREVAKALGDDLSRYENDEACKNQYRTTIASKAALIVVDDVWSKAGIDPLLAESPRSRFLFTTRDAAIGNLVGARDHRADLLDDAQSRELLALWANQPFPELPAVADEIIRECGRLPLALSVLGGMLRGKNTQYWADTLVRLRKADISSIRKQLPTGQETFFKAVETSFRSLEPEMQEQYKALAVLLEDMPAPLPILATLWNVDASDARLISNRLVELSLAQLEGATESIRLHDLQLDYVRAQYADKEALYLIHGALRLSSNVIARDPDQFASQMVGRLLSYQDMPAIADFTRQVVEGTQQPWLRSLHPALHPPGTALIRTLSGHAGSGYAVAMTPDGQWAVSVSSDTTLKVWDLASGRELRTLSGHTDCVSGVALSGDGRIAVSASYDQTLKVWDLASGRELRTLWAHSDGVWTVALTPDGQRAVSVSRGHTVRVWDLATGATLYTLDDLHSILSNAAALAVTKDGTRILIATGYHNLALYDLATGSRLDVLQGHSGAVSGVAVTPDGKTAISSSVDNTLKVWNLESQGAFRDFHWGAVCALAVAPRVSRAISASWDSTLKVWDAEAGTPVSMLVGHAGNMVFGASITSDGKLAVSGGWDTTVRLWDVAGGRAKLVITGKWGRVWAVAITPDGKRAVSGCEDGTVRVWDLASWRTRLLGKPLRTLEGHSEGVTSVAITQNGKRAVSGSRDNTLKMWDLEGGYALLTLNGHTDNVLGVAVTPDGRLAVSASHDRTLKVWDLVTGRARFALEGHSDSVASVGVTPDGKRAVSASQDETLKVWDLDTGVALVTFHCDAPACACTFLNSACIIAGDRGGRVYFLEIEEELTSRRRA